VLYPLPQRLGDADGGNLNRVCISEVSSRSCVGAVPKRKTGHLCSSHQLFALIICQDTFCASEQASERARERKSKAEKENERLFVLTSVRWTPCVEKAQSACNAGGHTSAFTQTLGAVREVHNLAISRPCDVRARDAAREGRDGRASTVSSKHLAIKVVNADV
jgi:hypothetical protein